jgi:hypothetical protein
MPMGDARLWEMPAHEMRACKVVHAYERRACERHAYEKHAYEMVYGRCTPIKCPSIGDVCLEDAFNQSIQIAFYHLGPPNGLTPCDLDVCVVGVVVIETT